MLGGICISVRCCGESEAEDVREEGPLSMGSGDPGKKETDPQSSELYYARIKSLGSCLLLLSDPANLHTKRIHIKQQEQHWRPYKWWQRWGVLKSEPKHDRKYWWRWWWWIGSDTWWTTKYSKDNFVKRHTQKHCLDKTDVQAATPLLNMSTKGWFEPSFMQSWRTETQHFSSIAWFRSSVTCSHEKDLQSTLSLKSCGLSVTYSDERGLVLLSVFHSCQPLLGVNLSPVFVNLYFPYAGRGLLFFCWWQWHFEFQPACVAVEGRSNVVLKTHAQL